MIGNNFYVLCCLGRCEVTPLQIVGTMDRMDWCDIYYGKLENVISTWSLLLV